MAFKKTRGQVFRYHFRQTFKPAVWQNGIADLLRRAEPLD
jgi:hypothetical protein